MPRWLDFSMDPKMVIEHYESCKLNNRFTHLKGYGLGLTWSFIKEKTELVGAHSSLVDAKAQMDVVLHPHFQPFVDRTKSMVRMEDVWKKKRARRTKVQEELKRPVSRGWTEDNKTEWSLPWTKSAKGPSGCQIEPGPSTKIKTAIAQDQYNNRLLDVFFFLFPFWLLETIATATEKYGQKDWVRPVKSQNADGGERKRPTLTPCTKDHPEAQHRVKEEHWRRVTVGYVLAFLAVLLARGAFNVRSPCYFWSRPPYGLSVPWIRNLTELIQMNL